MKRTIAITILVTMALVAITISVKGQVIQANAQEIETIELAARGRDVTLFGLIGLARGQTARLNVVNLRSLPAPQPTAEVVTPVPCSVRLRFLDQRGNVVARSVESILRGDGAFLDLPFHEAIPPGFGGNRFQIRAVVQVLRRPEDERRCATISSVEIFDNQTGRTEAIYAESPR